jgi:hypothetical protein
LKESGMVERAFVFRRFGPGPIKIVQSLPSIFFYKAFKVYKQPTLKAYQYTFLLGDGE